MDAKFNRRKMLLQAGATATACLAVGNMVVFGEDKHSAEKPDNQEAFPPLPKEGESRREQMKWYFDRGCCGSQAVLASYGDIHGMDRSMAMRMASGMSGGIGLLGEVCSFLIGASLLLGLKHGPKSVLEKKQNANNVEVCKQFCKDFKKEH